MKRFMLIFCIYIANNLNAQTQIRRDSLLQPPPPVYNPYQFPNYYQNNSQFVNNSMQTNPPANRKAGPYTGNADYSEPAKSTPPPTQYNNTGTAPVGLSPNDPTRR